MVTLSMKRVKTAEGGGVHRCVNKIPFINKWNLNCQLTLKKEFLLTLLFQKKIIII